MSAKPGELLPVLELPASDCDAEFTILQEEINDVFPQQPCFGTQRPSLQEQCFEITRRPRNTVHKNPTAKI